MQVKSVGKKKNGSEDEDESDTEDKRKFYWEVMEKTFVSEAAAYTFYNGYARQEGFSVRKFKFKETKGANKIVRRRRFVCSREGKRNSKFLTMDNRTRRLRPLSRCNCKAELDVKLDRGSGVWRVAKFVYKHSHKCAEPTESPFLWSHRRIKDFQKAEILALAAAGVRKHVIMDTFLSKYGRYTTVGFTRKDLYNMCCREKRKLLAGGDATSAIAMMENRRKKFADFFFEYDVDSKGRLKSLFWCDAQSRQDYNDYGDVLVFDSTYKMNRYGMPFVPFVGINNHRRTTVFACAILSDEKERTYVWLLKTFLKAMLQQKPKSIITDADSAMIRAIRSVFPEQSHRICSWHIEKNMARHLSFKSLSEFRALLYYTTTPDIFEERWHAFIQKWQTEKTQTWLKRMYKKRRLWAAAYLSEGFWLGMKSNQRSESLNSCLHLHLDYGMTLVDLILHYENAIVRIRETEAKDDCISSQTSPVPVTNLRRIERAAAKVFTPANFYILQQEIYKIEGIEVIDQYKGTEGEMQFVVAWKKRKHAKFYVDYKLANSDKLVECSCRRMIRRGLPCKHILHVLDVLDLDEIPGCLVLLRFSKQARGGLPARRTSDLYDWGFPVAEERQRFTELNVLQAEALQVAYKDPLLFERTKAFYADIISNKMEYDNVPNRPTNSLNTNVNELGDPAQVAARGAPKKRKRRDDGQGPVTMNGRPLSYDERGRGIRCSRCKKAGHTKRSLKCDLNPR
jgi:zinc finger SWIM domain-containing protein 3